MKWILIVLVCYNSMFGKPATSTTAIEFGSKKACYTAKAKLEESPHFGYEMTAICTEGE